MRLLQGGGGEGTRRQWWVPAACVFFRLFSVRQTRTRTLRTPPTHCLPTHRPRIETISWAPRAFIFHHFLTDDECEHMVQLAEKKVGAGDCRHDAGLGAAAGAAAAS